MGQQGFGTTTPSQILTRLITLYGKPSLNELEQALLHLNEPMDRFQPLEVMLRGVEEVKLFLLSSPDEHQQLPDALMIRYVLIKLTNTGLCAKALERWHGRVITERRQWSNCRPFFIQDYERMLREGSSSSMQQEGYGSAFHAMGMDDDDGESIVESIVRFSEKASAAEAKIVEMESWMSQMEQAALPS